MNCSSFASTSPHASFPTTRLLFGATVGSPNFHLFSLPRHLLRPTHPYPQK
jgi:hypothetical protein